MNLHGIVAPVTSAINPWVIAQVQKSTGYTTDANYKQVPTYATAVPIKVQKQALEYNDIVQFDAVNIQGERAAMYLDGNWEGVVRPDGTGGDLMTLPDGSIWLVVFVFENWSSTDGWTKVGCVRQMA